MVGPDNSSRLLGLVTQHRDVLPSDVGWRLDEVKPLLCPDFCLTVALPCLLHLPLHWPETFLMGMNTGSATTDNIYNVLTLLAFSWVGFN